MKMDRRDAFKKIGGLFAGFCAITAVPKESKAVEKLPPMRMLEVPPLPKDLYKARQEIEDIWKGMSGNAYPYLDIPSDVEVKIVSEPKLANVICQPCSSVSGLTTWMEEGDSKLAFHKEYECSVCKTRVDIPFKALTTNSFIEIDLNRMFNLHAKDEWNIDKLYPENSNGGIE